MRPQCLCYPFQSPSGGKGRASLAAAAAAWQAHQLHAHLNGLSVPECDNGFMFAAECLQAAAHSQQHTAHSQQHTVSSTHHTASSLGRSQADGQPWCVGVHCRIACLPHVPKTKVAVPEPCTHLGPCSTGNAQPVKRDCTSRLDVHHLQPSRRQPSKAVGPPKEDTVMQHCAEAPQAGCLCVDAVQGGCMAGPAAHPVVCVDGGDHCLEHRQVWVLQGLQVSLSDCRHATHTTRRCMLCAVSTGLPANRHSLMVATRCDWLTLCSLCSCL